MLPCYDDCVHHPYCKQCDDHGRAQREQLQGDWTVSLLFIHVARQHLIFCRRSLI